MAFTLKGPITPVLTGIPRGPTGNTGPDRVRRRTAACWSGRATPGTRRCRAKPTSLAGKVLRVTDIGRPAPGNPREGSRVFASGFGAHATGCASTRTDAWRSRPRSVPAARAIRSSGAGRARLRLPSTRCRRGAGGDRCRERAVTGRLRGARDSCSRHLARRQGTARFVDRDDVARRSTRSASSATALRASTAGYARWSPPRRRAVADDVQPGTARAMPVPTDERVLRIVPSGGGGQQPAADVQPRCASSRCCRPPPRSSTRSVSTTSSSA